MKKKLMLLFSVIIIILMIYFSHTYHTIPDNFSFTLPKDTKYIITYSSGPSTNEKSIVNYLDKKGDLIEFETLNKEINRMGIEKNCTTNQLNLFSHEKIFFDNSTEINNDEMTTLYKFSSNNGNDEVYASGYIDQLNMFYKHIPHGLSYEIEEYGYFDLLILYNEHYVYNITIAESGSIAVDNETGDIYNFYGNGGTTICYEKIVFDPLHRSFTKNNGEIPMTKFFNEVNQRQPVYFIGITLINDSTIYQVIHVGEGKITPYLIEYNIYYKNHSIFYNNNSPLNLDDGFLSIDTIYSYENNKIKFYSAIKPSKIIVFNTVTKTTTYLPFLETDINSNTNPFRIKKIGNNIYVLKSDLKKNIFEIYEIANDCTFDLLINGNLPRNMYMHDFWIVDFHIIY